jgi:hypothetical protein
MTPFRSDVRSRILTMCGVTKLGLLVELPSEEADTLDQKILEVAAEVLGKAQYAAFMLLYTGSDEEAIVRVYNIRRGFSEDAVDFDIISRNAGRALKRLMDVFRQSNNDKLCVVIRTKWEATSEEAPARVEERELR